MIRVDEALKIVLKHVNTLNLETVKLTDALTRVLAEDIVSDSDIPSFDNSAMDGYAVKTSDTRSSSRKKGSLLKVVDDIKAGSVSRKTLKAGEAIRIMTGATVPDGADSVIMVEETRKVRIGGKEFVELYKETKRGENIRRAGEDIKRGELVIGRGTLLKSAHIGILASLGLPNIKVTRRPKVAILATGDEVVDVDKPLTPGKLRSSNTYTLYSQVLRSGGIPKNLGIARDKPEELEAKIRKGLDCDLILTSGGVSVGDYDLVKFILAKMGTNIKFWQVAMRPGKPLAFGTIKERLVFGLPGNPVSGMVSFEVFVRPAILKMLGQSVDDRKDVDAVLEETINKKKGLRYFVRAETRWEDGVYLARPSGAQGSAILKSMARANSLLILPEEEERAEKGTRVTVRFLD